MPELIKFREKYPQYSDLDDTTIANKLATKYPEAYGDLPNKIQGIQPQQPPKKDLFDVALAGGMTPEEMSKGGNWVAGGIQQTAKDVLTSPAHLLNQFLMNYPRSITKTMGMEYPEAKSAVGNIAAKTAGVVGGFKNPLLKILKIGQPAKLLTNIAKGAALGATYAPTEDVVGLPERTGQAAVGATMPLIGAGIGKAGQIVTKAGRWVAKNVGGVSDATVNIIKRLGANRVFDPVKAQIDYIGKEIAPRVKERITNLITKFEPKSKYILKEIGMTPEEIGVLNSVDKSKLTQLQKVFGNDWNAIKGGLESIKAGADLQFKTTLQKNPKALINPKDTFYKLQGLLRKEGWIDYQGNEIQGAGIANKTKTNLIKIYQDLKTGLVSEGKQRSTGQINTAQYFNKLSELEATISGNPKFDRLVFDIAGSLRKDATKTIPGLTQANKSYSDAVKLLDLEKIFTKVTDPIAWEKQLLQLKNPAKYQLHNKLKNIMGKDIYDDVLSHLANQDFELTSNLPAPGGGMYPSRAGLIKGAISKGTKQYYQKVAPKAQAIKSGMGKVLEKLLSMQ